MKNEIICSQPGDLAELIEVKIEEGYSLAYTLSNCSII